MSSTITAAMPTALDTSGCFLDLQSTAAIIAKRHTKTATAISVAFAYCDFEIAE